MGLMLLAFFKNKKLGMVRLFVFSVLIFNLIYYFFTTKKDFYISSGDPKPPLHDDPNDKTLKEYLKSQFTTFFNLFYFSFVTQSTVGFGDIAPCTMWCRCLVIVQILASFIIITVG